MSVDNKIVSMTFNNASFQSKIGATLDSLAKLKDSLTMRGGAKGLADIDASAKKIDFSPIRKQAEMGEKAMSDLGASVKNMDFSPMGSGVEGLSAKFVALSTIAITALSNITSRVMSVGADMASAFSTDPIGDGFDEYELKMGSIQTIMAGSGASLGEVNNKLNELNTYADKTIYSFKDMTSNIGKFTNAGLSLETSVGAIQGVANVAARSGATSEEASRAMYNFSQALSVGSVKLMDWKSIELANMGTVEFKDQLIQAAEAQGTLTKTGEGLWRTLKGTEVTTKTFNSTLADGWLTSEALVDTLGKYSDTSTEIGRAATAAATEVKTFSQMMSTIKEGLGSGWAFTAEQIFGDFDESKKLFTDINNVVDHFVSKNADQRNRVFAIWKAGGGRDDLFAGLGKAAYGLYTVLKPLREGFREVFPEMTVKRLLDLSKGFNDLMAKMHLGSAGMDRLKRITSGIASVFKIAFAIVGGFGKMIMRVFSAITKGAGGGIFEVFADIGGAITRFQEALVGGGAIERFFELVGNAIVGFINGVMWVVRLFAPVANVFIGLFKFLGNGILTVGRFLFSFLPRIGRAFTDFFGKALSKIATLAKPIEKALSGFADRVSKFGSGLAESFSSLSKIQARASVALSGIGRAFHNFANLFTGALSPVGDILHKIGTSITRFSRHLQLQGFDYAIDRFHLFGVSISSMGDLIERVGDKLKGAGRAIGDFFGNLFGGGGSAKGVDPKEEGANAAKALFDIEKGASNLSKVLSVLGGIWDVFMAALGGVGSIIKGIGSGFMSIVRGIGDMFSAAKSGGGNIWDAIFSAVTFDRIIQLFKVGLVYKLLDLFGSVFGKDGLIRSISGLNASIGEVFDGLGDSLKAFSLKVKSQALMNIAIAVGILALSLGLISLLDTDKLMWALMAITLTLGELFAVIIAMDKLNLASSSRQMLVLSGAMILMSVAVLILAAAVKIFGSMDQDELEQGLIAVGAALAGLAVATSVIKGQVSGMAGTGLALIGMGLALVILSYGIKKLGNMDDDAMVQGLFGVVMALTALTVALKVIDSKDVAAKGLAFLLITFSLKRMSESILIFAGIPFWTMAKGGAYIAAMLAAIGFALRAFPSNMPAMGVQLILLSVALQIMAGAIIKIGNLDWDKLQNAIGSILIILVAIAGVAFVLSKSGGGAVALVMIAGALLVLAHVIEFLGKLPWQVIALGVGAVVLALVAIGLTMAVLGKLAPLIFAFGVSMALAGAGILLFGAGLFLAATAVTMFAKDISKNVAAVTALAIAFIQLLPRLMGAFGAGLLIMFSEFLKGVTPLVDIIMNIFGQILDGVAKMVPKIMKIFGLIIAGIIKIIRNEIPNIVAAGFELLMALLKGIEDNIGEIVTTVANIITEFFDAMTEKVPEVVDSIFTFLETVFVEVVKRASQLGKLFGPIGGNIISGITSGLSSAWESITSFFTNAWNALIGIIKRLLGINSPSTVFASIGRFLIEGLIKGINAIWNGVITFFKNVPGKILGALGDLLGTLINKGKDLISGILKGITDAFFGVAAWFVSLPGKILDAIGDVGGKLISIGSDLIGGLWNGLQSAWGFALEWVKGIPGKALDALKGAFGLVGKGLGILWDVGKAAIDGLKKGMEKAWESVTGWLPGATAQIKGLTEEELKVKSPSRVMMKIGGYVMEGLLIGMQKEMPKSIQALGSFASDIPKTLDDVKFKELDFKSIFSGANGLDSLNPTITPVIDLTEVELGAARMARLLSASQVMPVESTSAAGLISHSLGKKDSQETNPSSEPKEINFNQTINAPEPLSTNDIYRNTKSQISLAKEELHLV